MRKVTKLSYLGACFRSGQPIKGVEFAPKAVRESGIFEGLKQNYGVTVNDHGDVHELHEQKQIHKSHIKNLHVLDPSLHKLNDRVTEIANKINDNQEVLVTIGGDHSIATSTIHAMMGKYPDLKVIWVDAHGDMIDASKSPYEGYHGMPLSHLLGVNDGVIPGFKWLTRRIKPQNIVHIGLRDIDTDQWDTIARLKIKCFTPDHIDMLGIGEVMRQAIEYLDPSNGSKDHKSAPFHISFDIDALDPLHSQATGTIYRGGLSYRQACHIVRRTAWQRKVVSMDIVEINPTMEQGTRKKYRGQEKYVQDLKLTVGMGIDLIDSLFKRYLSL